MSAEIQVLLCFDKNVLNAAHVTIYSALQHVSRPTTFHIFHEGLSERDKKRLSETCSLFPVRSTLIYYSIDLNYFKRFRSLVGNHFAYARLLAGEYIEHKRIIYLDVDLLIKMDIAKLFDYETGGYLLAASGVGVTKTALEHELFAEVGFAEDTKVFNSGVLLIDLDMWNEKCILEQCIKLGEIYNERLLSADQTMLNLVLRGDFCELPAEFNVPRFPGSFDQDFSVPAIYHFVGAPKPWDPFASFLHGSYGQWWATSKLTALPWQVRDHFGLISIGRIARLLPRYWGLVRLAIGRSVKKLTK